jgi:dUTP pyrophosphatase
MPYLIHATGHTITRATAGAAGYDLTAAAPALIPSGAWRAIPTGVRLAMPHGMEAQVRPRSGLALKHGVTVLNAPGTIDSDYRGEVSVLLINHGREPFGVAVGDRIAQMVFAAVVHPQFVVGDMCDTARGVGGFGSTGIAAAQGGGDE